jgi:hypothetical protein
MSASMPADDTAALAHKDLLAGRYLSAWARLRGAGGAGRPDLWNLWFWTVLAIDPWYEGWPVEAGEPQAPAGTLADAEPDGLAAVTALAAGAVGAGRLVVLMERHALPETRWAGVRLLPALRRAGATHLAFEASDQRLLDRARIEGTVRSETAPYMFEPSRAALLRTAIRLGLQLAAFDYPTDPELLAAIAKRQGIPDDINRRRERWMAENLHRLVSEQPDARVVVWTGGQHAWRHVPDYYSVPFFDSWARDPTMAAVLTEISGREPYCVGQAVVRGQAPGEPRVLRADHPWAAAHGQDAVLVHFRGGPPRRPSWLDEGRRTVALPDGGAHLVQAFPEAEGPEAVPADQAISRGRKVDLLLDPGRYRCRGVDGSDHPLWQRSLHVRP